MVFLGGHPVKYYSHHLLRVQYGSVCVSVLLCLVFIIAIHLGNMVIVYQLSPLTLQITLYDFNPWH